MLKSMAARSFQRMSQRMTVDEVRPYSGLTCTGSDDACLDGDVVPQPASQQFAVSIPAEGTAAEQLELLRESDQRVLEELNGTELELPLRQRPQAVDVDDDRARLPEGAHEVLAGLQVQARLAADPGVDHAQQAGGHAVIIDPAQVDRKSTRLNSSHVAISY